MLNCLREMLTSQWQKPIVQQYRQVSFSKENVTRIQHFMKGITDFMNQIIDKGYAVKVPETKEMLRVVFDCAFKGTSINTELLEGPDLVNSLVGVLMRVRHEQIALTAEIEAMYHQLRVLDEDMDLVRFLWWPNEDTEHNLVEYKITVHLFGGTSSPTCANFA
ncbi:hypothetical protein EXN66_Car008196 [Channa argus]|uniref:Uncharacterized protein n=1 Tax=Channa argus TaxID=215402 RepID=A0A6G1PQE4_CHAAH|nr:hypothetical protein EXN66_Car008196 [Channa argus]